MELPYIKIGVSGVKKYRLLIDIRPK